MNKKDSNFDLNNVIENLEITKEIKFEINQFPSGAMVLDKDLNILYANQYLLKQLFQTKNQLLGSEINSILDNVA